MNKQTDIQLTYLDKFIGIWDNAFDPDFAKWIIDYWKTTKYISSRNNPVQQDKQIVLGSFSPGEALFIQECVDKCLGMYMDKYPYLANFNYYSGLVLLQKTEPMEGYHAWHGEDSTWEAHQRTLAWTVYFNDIEDSGETEFLYQQTKVTPKNGRIAIWPGSFTHLHRGNPPNKTKYIATGWYAGDGGMQYFKPGQHGKVQGN